MPSSTESNLRTSLAEYREATTQHKSKHLVAKGTLAALSAVALVNSVDADVVRIDDAAIGQSANSGITLVDLNGDGTDDVSLFALTNQGNGISSGIVAITATSNGFGFLLGTPGTSSLNTIPAGALISTINAFNAVRYVQSTTGGVPINSGTLGGPGTETGFIGVAFSEGIDLRFGWLQIQVSGFTGQQGNMAFIPDTITILDGYYDDSVESIEAGVPEPTSLGLLALGAAGVLFNRRRRNETTEEAAT